MRVLMVSNYFSGHGGGIELVAGNLVRSLQNAGLDLRWAAFSSGLQEEDRASALALTGSNIIEDKSGIPFPVLSLSSVLKLRREIRQADLVHVHDCIYESSRIAAYEALRLGKPALVTQHIGHLPYKGLLHKSLYALANAFLTRPLLSRATKVIFISENVRAFFRSSFKQDREPALIFNGLDIGRFNALRSQKEARRLLKLADEKPIALFVGRFVEKKGLARIRQLATLRHDVLWVLAGKGNEDPAHWNLPNVRILGHLPQASLPLWFQAADLFTLLSVGEGFPLVIQEALGCGCPCFVSDEIATACPSIQGHVVRANPTFSDLKERLDEALALRAGGEVRRQERAQHFAQLWNWDSCARAYLKLYNAIQGERYLSK